MLPDMLLDPSILCIHPRPCLVLCRKRGLLRTCREQRMKCPRDRKPLGVVRQLYLFRRRRWTNVNNLQLAGYRNASFSTIPLTSKN
jgi:hypothetical protein